MSTSTMAQRGPIGPIDRAGADEQARHASIGRWVADRPMRERFAGERVEALNRKRQVRPALVARDGVDFVHDHGGGLAKASRLWPR